MKYILLIAALLIFSMASSKVIEVKKSITRSIGDEDVALELKFQGTCEEFKARVLPTVWISKGQSCLPIKVNEVQNPDENDLNAHFFCTHVEEGRSIVHFVEIFEATDATGYPNFVLSLIPSNPFRVLTPKTSLARRPDCHITHDFCNETNVIVDSCSTNNVRIKERKNKSQYVVSNDRIYITANQQVSSDCKANGNCCAYVAPQSFGGICDHVGSRDLLSFPKHHDEHKNDHKKGKKGGNKEGRPGRPGPGNREGEDKPEEHKKEEDNQVDEVKKEDNQVEQKKKRPGQGRKGKKPPTNRKGKNRPNSTAVRPPNNRNGRPASHRPSSNRPGSKRPPTNKKGPLNKKTANKKPPQPEEEEDDEEDEDK